MYAIINFRGVIMNAVGTLLIVLIILLCLIYNWIKKAPKKAIQRALKQHDYEHALKILDAVGIEKIVSPFEKDKLLLKTYFMAGKKENFLKQIQHIGHTQYKEDGKIRLLEIWFHHCLQCDAKEFADAFLNEINVCADSETMDLANLSYQILINKETISISTLDEKIQKIKNPDFHSGLLYYLKGMLYFYRQDLENALHSFDNALFNFEACNSGIYYDSCKKMIDTYGNSSYLHYGTIELPKLYKEIDMVERYRYTPPSKTSKKKSRDK